MSAYIEQLAQQAARVLALNQPPGYPEPVAATWNVSIERLQSRSPAAVRLLQLCAFFAPEPISANLLYSKEMIDALKPYDSSLQEKLVLGRVIREIGRFALAKVDQVSNSIQVHRLVQAVIRAQLSEEEQREARHAVHRILAGARPDDDEPIDNPETWPRFNTIWPHLTPSEARFCKEPETRRLLIDRVRYLWKRGDFKAAYALGEELRETWRETLGGDDLQYLYLRFHLSNILRSQGRFVEAMELDEGTLERQQAALGASHPHTYMTTSGLAMDLGALGRYGEAMELATAAHEGFGQIFHEAHPRTLAAANNLALNLRMIGQYARARRSTRRSSTGAPRCWARTTRTPCPRRRTWRATCAKWAGTTIRCNCWPGRTRSTSGPWAGPSPAPCRRPRTWRCRCAGRGTWRTRCG